MGTLFLVSIRHLSIAILYTSNAPEARLGEYSYFCARDEAHGEEVWRSDGTLAGTTLVTDIVPGAESSMPYNFIVVNGGLFFFTIGEGGSKLWRYTPGSPPVDLGLINTSPDTLAVVDNLVYFFRYSNEAYALWRSDGTPAGTTQIALIGSNYASSLIAVGTKLFFTTNGGTGCVFNYVNCRLWVSDGTAAGTRLLIEAPQPSQAITQRMAPVSIIRDYTVFGSQLIFNRYAVDGGTWISDGTPEGTRRLLTQTANSRTAISADGSIIVLPTASDGLWRSDGTAAGTVRIAEGNMDQAARVGHTLFFSKSEGDRIALWSSDFAGAGATRLATIERYNSLVPFGDALLFAGSDAAHGSELWRSDGTPGGTSLLVDINPGVSSSLNGFNFFFPTSRAQLNNGRLFFFANNGLNGREPFVTDGSAAGTRMLVDATIDAAGSTPQQLRVVGNKLFFLAQPRELGPYVLYTAEENSDPNAVAELVGGAAPITSADTYTPNKSTVVNNRYLALITDGRAKKQLWASDGTSVGTTLLAEFNASQSVEALVSTGLQAFYTVQQFSEELQTVVHDLYRTDGTAAGTVLLGRFSYMGQLTTRGNMLYFTAEQNGSAALWRSDGTPAGTAPLVVGVNASDIVATNTLF